MVSLGELLRRSNETALLDFDTEYHEVTIRLWGKGVISRGKVKGGDVGTSRQVVRANQLILSKIDARNGAIGIVPPELDGAIVSNDFPSFEFAERLDSSFMGWLVRSTPFVELCKAASEGTTNRVRIKEDRFLTQQIQLPSLEEQQTIVARLDLLADRVRQVNEHLDAAEADAANLLAVQFREAVKNAPMRKMSEVAPLVRREISIDSEAIYTELGVRSFFKGAFVRRTLPGLEYSWQKLYQVQMGDLIFSNIMAWEQAIAIASAEHDNCVGNHRMLTCSAKREIAIPEFIWYYFTTPEGFAKIEATSPGTAARNKTLTADALMNIEAPLPCLEAQKEFALMLNRINELKTKHTKIREANQALIPATLERVFSNATGDRKTKCN